MDSELKKTSVRANRLEKKRFELMLAAFDTAKRNVAVDMKKSQLDFKRRLKRYKDRQREIIVAKYGPSTSSMDEFVLSQLKRRSHLNHALRPHTSPHPPGSLSLSHSPGSNDDVSGPRSQTTGPGSDSRTLLDDGTVTTVNGTTDPADYTEDEDFVKLSHCRRSKIDLRPCTAWRALRNSPSPSKIYLQTNAGSSSTSSGAKSDDVEDPSSVSATSIAATTTRPSTTTIPTSSGRPGTTAFSTRPIRPNTTAAPPSSWQPSRAGRLLNLRNGSLGSHAMQVKYLNDEEIEERCTFYRFLLDGYRVIEHRRLEMLNERVDVFCGKQPDSGSFREASCPPIQDGSVVSLPASVPPIVHQAIKVKVPPLNGLSGHLQRAKTQ